MFNGIKSILFGYSAEEQTETSSNADNTANRSVASRESSIISSSSSFSHDTSALLEQTLNAAATKLTEQLVPRCPSIEQLQSSSHQLLPTLNEQHEEDELKRRKLNEVIEANNSENNAEDADDDDDDDDDGFNADSWELLDLVEKQPLEPSSIDEQKDNSSKTSGILKSSKTSTSSSNSQNNNESVVGIQKRQNKPKVSFETPDLVKETKEKIERITPKEKDVKLGNQKQEKKEEKKKKKVDLRKSKKFGGNIDHKSIDLFCCELFPEIATDENIEKVVELKEKVEVNQLESSCKVLKPQPVLNYAAALSMKLNKSADVSEKLSTDGSSKNPKSDVKTSLSASSTSKSNVDTNVKGSFQTSGAVKRNRPVSFSSSSCENDDEDFEIAWNDVIEPESTNIDGKCKKWQLDDGNDSIVSSGFSDCDYGYEGLNDIIMRPKKASGKKRRGLSGSHRASIKKRDPINGGEVVVAAKNKTLATNGSSSATAPERKSSLGSVGKETLKPLISVSSSKNNIKPKKKKIILSSTASSYEFMKKRSFNDGEQPTTGFKLVGTPSSETQIVESKSTTCEPFSAFHLMPPPQSSSSLGTLQTGSNTNSGNDSSDIADMDESWYVTPPPCFTGSNRFMKSKVAKFSKAKEADRENALIEHPSIYIASTSKQQPSAQEKQQPDRDVVKNKEPAKAPMENNLLLTNKRKPIVLRKVGKVANNAVNSSSSDSDNKRKIAYPSTTTNNKSLASKHQSQTHNKKDVVKAWENKFIVTNWSLDDEQEDVNEDFDNMFDEIDNKCSSSKNQSFKLKKPSSKTKVQNKRKEEIKLQSLRRSIAPEVSPGYESDEFSIPSPALMNDIEVSSSDVSLGEVVPSPNSLVLISNNSSSGDENLMPEKQQSEIFGEIVKRHNHELVGSAEKKAPTQVRPIEPERKPGWQLRRKRSRRRPLSASMSNTCNAASDGVKLTSVKPLTSKQQQQMMLANNSSSDGSRSASRSGCSNLSSSCSSPTLIDHMSSIVANLTSGFTATANNSLPFQSRSTIDVECMEKSIHAAMSLSPHSEQSNLDSVSKRRLSKSYLDRQNNCSKLGNINRRADRRMKMRTTPNGYSINRKVHTNFH